MPRTYEIPEDFDAHERPLPGIYHVFVYNIDESEQRKDGSSVEGVQVALKIVAGTTPGQVGRVCNTTFFNPDPKDPEKFRQALQKITRFIEVTQPALPKAQKGKPFVFDWKLSKHTQLIVKLEEYISKKDGKTGISVADFGRGFYRFDDPAVAHVPVNLPGTPFHRPNGAPQAGGATAAPKPVNSNGIVNGSPVKDDDIPF